MINIKSQKQQKINFPVARRSVGSGTVVLFFGETEGIILNQCEALTCPVGTYRDNWFHVNSNAWEPVNVEISG